MGKRSPATPCRGGAETLSDKIIPISHVTHKLLGKKSASGIESSRKAEGPEFQGGPYSGLDGIRVLVLLERSHISMAALAVCLDVLRFCPKKMAKEDSDLSDLIAKQSLA